MSIFRKSDARSSEIVPRTKNWPWLGNSVTTWPSDYDVETVNSICAMRPRSSFRVRYLFYTFIFEVFSGKWHQVENFWKFCTKIFEMTSKYMFVTKFDESPLLGICQSGKYSILHKKIGLRPNAHFGPLGRFRPKCSENCRSWSTHAYQIWSGSVGVCWSYSQLTFWTTKVITHSHARVRATTRVNGETQTLTPQPRSNPISDSHKLAEVITSWTPTPVQKFVTIRPGVSFPRMRDFVFFSVFFSFFWVLATRYSQGP